MPTHSNWKRKPSKDPRSNLLIGLMNNLSGKCKGKKPPKK